MRVLLIFTATVLCMVTGWLLFPTMSEASGPAIKWEQTYDESSVCEAMIPTSDGGYLLGGYQGDFSPGEADALIIKTDNEGNEEWRSIFGGDRSETIEGMKEVPGEGYILIGYSYSFSHNDYCDYYLIMIDYQGNEIWSRTYGGSYWDFGLQVELGYEDGFVFVGTSYSYGEGIDSKYIIKTDDEGNLVWETVISNTFDSTANDITKTKDGNYFIVGEDGNAYSQIGLVKMDRDGNVIWEKKYGGSSNDYGYSVKTTVDGGAIIAGKTMSFGPPSWNAYVVRTDRDGNELWERYWGGDRWDPAYSVINLPDGGFLVGGSTGSFGLEHDKISLIRLNREGETIWMGLYGSSPDARYTMDSSDICLNGNGGYTVAGLKASYSSEPGGFYLFETESEFLIDLDTEIFSVVE